MKKLYSFVISTMLIALFSMTATAQHYVRVNNDLKLKTEINFFAGSILPKEVDSILYIRIIKDKKPLNRNGVTTGAVFPLEKYDSDIAKCGFRDTKGELRSDCFDEAEIIVKYNNTYIPYNDIDFVPVQQINKDSISTIRDSIISHCTYDSSKKTLTSNGCPYMYIRKGVKIGYPNLEDVDDSENIEFIIDDKLVPNLVFSVKDFIKEESHTKGEIDDNKWYSKYWKEILFSALILLLLILVALWFVKRKNNIKASQETSNNNPEETHEVSALVVDEKLHQKLADVLARIETTQNAVNKQTAALESIRLLVSNTEDKKQLAQKNQELEAEKKKTDSAITQRDTALSNIEKLKKEIVQLQAGSQIEGAVQVAEYSSFVSFAKKIVSECVDAENTGIRYWSTLGNKDQQLLNGFLSKFQMAKCQINLAKWNGIIATLDLKGYIKNDEYITYLTPLSDKDRLAFLSKRFFEDILRPYVGATILFLEQIRTAAKIGVSLACNENIEGFINSICTKCYEQGVLIDYRKLYEKVTEFDTLEIDENIPDTIKKVIAKIEEEDILLYVDKYAVNLKSGEMAEKTRCYIKI